MKRETTANLRRTVRALSLHPWLNTAEEKDRLARAKDELASRKGVR